MLNQPSLVGQEQATRTQQVAGRRPAAIRLLDSELHLLQERLSIRQIQQGKYFNQDRSKRRAEWPQAARSCQRIALLVHSSLPACISPVWGVISHLLIGHKDLDDITALT